MDNKIKQIEKILGAPLDGKWDEKDQLALDALIKPKKTAKPMLSAAPTGAPAQQMAGPPAGAMPATYVG